MTARTPGDRPLDGRRILLTRPSESGHELLERLVALGAEVDWRPAIALEPPDDAGPVERAVRGLSDYDWLIFTSANGVRFFQTSLDGLGVGWDRFAGSIAAIGPATAAALIAAGQPPGVVARTSRAEGLVEALSGKIRSGQRALLVRPEKARAVIPDALNRIGVRVDAVAFYRTVAASGIESTVSELGAGRYDIAVFTSPSAFRFVEACAERSHGEGTRALRTVSLVAIGDVTAGEMRRAGYDPAAVATAPTHAELERAILSVADDDAVGPGDED